VNLEGVTHDEAVAALKATQERVTLRIAKLSPAEEVASASQSSRPSGGNYTGCILTLISLYLVHLINEPDKQQH